MKDESKSTVAYCSLIFCSHDPSAVRIRRDKFPSSLSRLLRRQLRLRILYGPSLDIAVFHVHRDFGWFVWKHPCYPLVLNDPTHRSDSDSKGRAAAIQAAQSSPSSPLSLDHVLSTTGNGHMLRARATHDSGRNHYAKSCCFFAILTLIASDS